MGVVRAQMTDAPVIAGDMDGPTGYFANRPLALPWAHPEVPASASAPFIPGGDWRDAQNVAQGSNHYATVAISDYHDVVIPCASLIARLLVENTGIYVRQLSGTTKFVGMRNPNGLGPRLHVVTDKGVFDPVCIVDVRLAGIYPGGGHEAGGVELPGIFKFDLSQVTGVVTDARLTLAPKNYYNGSIALDYLDAPSLNLNADGSQIGTRIEGIAATVAQDKALASHPSVLRYDDFVSKAYLKAMTQAGAGAPPTIDANVDIIDWPQYGLKAARFWSITTNERIVDQQFLAEPKSSPPKSWQRDFGNGHEHLFCRFIMRIGADVKDGMATEGAKLPGMAGMYNLSNSGAVTLPEPSDYWKWEGRLWHTGVSPAHPGFYHVATYYYGTGENNVATNYNSPGGLCLMSSGYLKEDRDYSIEQEVKLNTFTNGVPNADGVMRVWIDAVKVYERTDLKIRGADNVRIQAAPWLNIYHGGHGVFPKKPFHYDLGGLVLATEYIGPPKLLAAHSAPQTGPAMTKQKLLDDLAAQKAATATLEVDINALPDDAPPPQPQAQTNVALASAGATAGASTTLSSYPASKAINDERSGAGGNFWADNTQHTYPDWLQINFSGSKTIDRAVVYSPQDDYLHPIEPTDAMTFALYGVADFTVEAMIGGAWQVLATIVGNNLVKRTVTFAAVTTDKIRVVVTKASDGYCRITEVEAWGFNSGAAGNGAPPVGQTLAQLAATIPVNSWTGFRSNNIQALELSGTPSRCILPFMGAMPWNPIRKKWHIVGTDHGVVPAKLVELDDATTAWSNPSTVGATHGYEHLTVNPFTGVPYFWHNTGLAECTVETYDGPEIWTPIPPPLGNWSGMQGACCCWWSGPDSVGRGSGQGFFVLHHTSNGQLHCWNPLTRVWTVIQGVMMSSRGMYQRVIAYSRIHNCIVIGGGNGSSPIPNDPLMTNNTMQRINADGSVTDVPTPPHHPGVYSGCQLIDDDVTGNFLLIGFGETWELNPGDPMKWTKRADMHPAMLQPQSWFTSVASCSTYGLTLYVDSGMGDTRPGGQTQMWAFKNAEQTQ